MLLRDEEVDQVNHHVKHPRKWGWLGADGENYFKGVDGLYAEGFFSKADILNYWPAGYPILLWLLSY
jgi:hypothetical protein